MLVTSSDTVLSFAMHGTYGADDEDQSLFSSLLDLANQINSVHYNRVTKVAVSTDYAPPHVTVIVSCTVAWPRVSIGDEHLMNAVCAMLRQFFEDTAAVNAIIERELAIGQSTVIATGDNHFYPIMN
jgi:hypothetical protein